MDLVPTDYLPFDLAIEREGSGYVARVASSPSGEASEPFTPPFSELELENFWLRIGVTRGTARRVDSPELAAVKDFGARLFDAAFAGEVRACLRAATDAAEREGKAGVRIRLRLGGVPELGALPWEYLYSRAVNRFLALSVKTPVVRYLELPDAVPPPRVELPIRVLVMASKPTDHDALDTDAELARLTRALAGLSERGVVKVDRLREPTLAALQRELRTGRYHVFHFMGHGGFDARLDDGVLVFEDERGRGDLVSAQDLGTLLHDEATLRLAILNACEGARGSRTDPFSGTAQALVQQGVPAVVAMQVEISDEAAVAFAQGMYGALADGYPVDAALAESRKTLFAGGHRVEWGTPVLYMRSPDGRLFELASAAGALAGDATPRGEADPPTPSDGLAGAPAGIQGLLARPEGNRGADAPVREPGETSAPPAPPARPAVAVPRWMRGRKAALAAAAAVLVVAGVLAWPRVFPSAAKVRAERHRPALEAAIRTANLVESRAWANLDQKVDTAALAEVYTGNKLGDVLRNMEQSAREGHWKESYNAGAFVRPAITVTPDAQRADVRIQEEWEVVVRDTSRRCVHRVPRHTADQTVQLVRESGKWKIYAIVLHFTPPPYQPC